MTTKVPVGLLDPGFDPPSAEIREPVSATVNKSRLRREAGCNGKRQSQRQGYQSHGNPGDHIAQNLLKS